MPTPSRSAWSVVAWVVVALVITALTFLYVKEREARVRETMIAGAARDTLVAAMEADRAERAEHYRQDSAIAAVRIELADRGARRAEGELANQRARYTKLLDSIATAMPDLMAALTARLQAGWAEVQRQTDSTLAAKEGQVHGRDIRIAELEAQRTTDLQAFDVQFAACQHQLNAAIQRNAPDLLQRALLAVPYVAVGLVVGRLLK